MNSRNASREDELRQQTVSYESANMDGNIYRYKPYTFIADTISNIDNYHHWDFFAPQFLPYKKNDNENGWY